MRYFSHAQQLWKSLVSDLLTMGNKVKSRNGDTREIIGWTGYLSSPLEGWAGDLRRASMGYGCAELLWYFRGSQDVEPMLSAYAPSYVRYANDGKAMGAYGDRWLNNPGIRSKGTGRSALWNAVQLLRENPEDRRAVVSFWDSGDVVEARKGEWKDIPCTLSMQFLVRGKSLHCVTNMRSNDVWLGGVYDIFCFTQIQCLMAAALGLGVGTYVHSVGSMHLYEKNVDKALEAMTAASGFGCCSAPIPMPTAGEALALIAQDGSALLLQAEEALRTGGFSALANFLEVCGPLPAWSMRVVSELGRHLYTPKGEK